MIGGRSGGVVLLGLFVSARVEAAAIEWSGGADCRRELEVIEQVESMIGRKLSQVEAATFELRLETSDEARLRLSLSTLRRSDGERSTRTFEGASCTEVTDAAAVAIALTIGGEKQASRVEPDPERAPTPQASLADFGTDQRPRPPALVRSAGPSLHVGVSAALDSSATPQLVPGGLLRLSLVTSKLRGELEGGFYAPGERINEQSGEGGSFQLLYLAPLVCGQAALGRPSALICAGYELGQLTAEGEGVENSYVRRTLWHGPRAQLGLTWPLTADWSLMGRLGGVLALSRHSFVLDAPEAVHRPGRFSLRAAIGVELKLF